MSNAIPPDSNHQRVVTGLILHTRGGVIWLYNHFWLTRTQIMDQVGVFEAKARLSELVAKAERGGETTITRNGKVVARLVPAAKARGKSHNPAVMIELRHSAKPSKSRGASTFVS